MKNKYQKKYNLAKYIQLFAEKEQEGGEGGDNTPQPKTYTEEEYNKLKAQFDKTSSELADKKKQEKARLSEEEKKSLEQKEKDEKLSNLEKELLGIKMSKEFMLAGFDENSTNAIIDSFNKRDSVEFAKTLSTKIKELVEQVKKNAQQEFQQSQTTPPSSTSSGTDKDPYVQNYINRKTNQSNNKARDYYFGKD